MEEKTDNNQKENQNEINMEILRKGDIVHFSSGETSEIFTAAFNPNDNLYYLQFDEKTAFRYNSAGKCQFPSYDIVDVELVPQPDDDKVLYVPDIFCGDAPVVSLVCGGKVLAQKLVKTIFDLQGFGGAKIPGGSHLEAGIVPTVFAQLKKIKGRDVIVLKTETIFCKTREEAEKKRVQFAEKYQYS